MRTLTYRLTVMKPGSFDQELFRLESSTPFGAMGRGDAFRLDDGRNHSNISRVMHGFSEVDESLVQTTSVFLSADATGGSPTVSDPAIAPPSPVRDELASTDEFGS